MIGYRKFAALMVGIVSTILVSRYPNEKETILSIAGMVSLYILGQSQVDAKGGTTNDGRRL